MSKITEIVDGVISKVNEHTSDISSIETLNSTHIELSGATAYHLLQGNMSLSNTISTNGFSTTLYTGNGSTQSINTGVDMDTQWGDDVSERFCGLVWLKGRSVAYNHLLFDTIRGTQQGLHTNLTNIPTSYSNALSAFSANGFSYGADGTGNTNLATYVSWNFQATHRTSGTTNHGKAYTCHYNPFTGFTIVKYEGSGIAGHEIPHHLGRKLVFNVAKSLSAVNNWEVLIDNGSYLFLNATNGQSLGGTWFSSDDNFNLGNTGGSNASGNQYIMYGWANSYFDESNKLIGNYYTYVDNNGILRMNVHTSTSREQVLWQMSKATLTTGDWDIVDFTRVNTKELNANSSAVESTITANTLVNTNSPATYPRATDATQIQLNNALVPLPNGIDTNGIKVSTVSKNETVTGVTLTQGKNYLRWEN
jgi:hypothetical protein